MPTHKTTPQEFQLFKETFLEWQTKLGLNHYNVWFHLGWIGGCNAACITVSVKDKSANVWLNTKIEKIEHIPENLDYASHARHECLHLFLRQLTGIKNKNLLLEREEDMVRIIERLL